PGDRLHTLDQLVETPVVDVGTERQGEMPLGGVGPRQARPWLEEPLQFLANPVGRHDRDEHPMPHHYTVPITPPWPTTRPATSPTRPRRSSRPSSPPRRPAP